MVILTVVLSDSYAKLPLVEGSTIARSFAGASVKPFSSCS